VRHGQRGAAFARGGEPGSIRLCGGAEFDAVWSIINAAATAYDGVIPADRYHVPYMPVDELRREIGAGVRFWGWHETAPAASSARPGPAGGGWAPAGDRLVGVMGIQDVDDVTLIRHAYVEPTRQGTGVGGALLAHLLALASPDRPLLVGTWAAASWAVRFYERHGFALVTPDEKDRLLRRYWNIADRQVETSVVLRLREEPRDTASDAATDERMGRGTGPDTEPCTR